MKKNKKSLIVAVFLMAAVLIISLVACGGGAQSSDNTKQASNTADGNNVILKNNRFSPASLTIKVGTTVTWTNEDGFIHTVTSGTSPSDPSGLFDSGNLNGGDTFSFTFDEAGTYDYFCIPHFSLGMIGKIIVTE
ncbi:MAG: cupredoxin domain-containing protein [Candidatus Humimicrobiaceae bacterium]